MYKLPKKKSSSEGNNRGRSIWGHPIIHYNSFFLAWLVIQGVPLWDVPKERYEAFRRKWVCSRTNALSANNRTGKLLRWKDWQGRGKNGLSVYPLMGQCVMDDRSKLSFIKGFVDHSRRIAVFAVIDPLDRCGI